MKIRKSAKLGEKGTAMVEFSLILPILITLVAGIIDLCGWLQTHIKLSRATYEVARYAAIQPGFSYSDSQQVILRERFIRVVRELNQEKNILKDATLLWDDPKQDAANADKVIFIQARSTYEPQFLRFLSLLKETRTSVQIVNLT